MDSRSGQAIYELLRESAHERTLLVAAHVEDLARSADRVIYMRDGRPLASAHSESAGDP